jgi:hypothetical protein
MKDKSFTPEKISEIANHVSEFSLAGIRRLARSSPADDTGPRRIRARRDV